VAAVPLLLRRGARKEAWLAAWSLAFAAVVMLSYVWYLPFPDWYFLRFLLPAFPLLLATAAATLVLLASRSTRATAIGAAVVIAVIGHGLSAADTAFVMRQDQSRYRAAAIEARSLPRDAIVISNLHSGSVHYYAERQTVRYEWVPWYDYGRTMAFLRSLRRPLFVMLDNLELADFRARYRCVADLSWLDHPMKIINERVRLYRLPDTHP
jgi:hypothetical protein